MNINDFYQKTRPSLCVIALLMGAITVMPAYAATAPASATQRTLVTTVFKVPGMTCADKACDTSIYIALHRLHGVKKIQMDDMAKTVTVRYDPKDVSVPTLLHTFTHIGYPASIAPQ